MASHVDPKVIDGASLDASIILRQVLASLIAGVSTEVMQTNDYDQIQVNVISTATGLKFTFVLPSAAAIVASMTADIVMSNTSVNPVQNKVIKAYIDGQFWTGTATAYVENAATLAGKICFLSDTHIVMYNGAAYSLQAHAHGDLTNNGAIGNLAGMVVMTGEDGKLETITVAALKELLGSSAGLNLLHNAELSSPFNTKALTIYSSTGECIDRWDLAGAGTFTLSTGYATLAQATVNTARLKQILPEGSYLRLLHQTLMLSVATVNDEAVFSASGTIDGEATTIIDLALISGFKIKLVADNATKTVYVELYGTAMISSIDLLRIKLEIGESATITNSIIDSALDLARIQCYDLAGVIRVAVTDYVRYGEAMALTSDEQARVRTSLSVPSIAAVTPSALGVAKKSVILDATLLATEWGADCTNVCDEIWESGAIDSSGVLIENIYTLRSKNPMVVVAGTNYRYVDDFYGGGQRYLFWYAANTFLSRTSVLTDGGVYQAPATANRCKITINNLNKGWVDFNTEIENTDWEPQGKGIHLKTADYAQLSAVHSITAVEILPPRSSRITDKEIRALQAANIFEGYLRDGEIILHARGTVPTIDLPIRIIVRGDFY